MAYDPLTDAYSNDEKTDEAAFAKSSDTGAGETEVSQDAQDADTKEDFKEEKVSKLNKKMIIIFLAAAAILLLALRFFKNHRPDIKKTQEKKQASDIIVPEFGDYKNRGYKDTPITEEKDTSGTEESKIPARAADYELPKPENTRTAPRTQNAPSSSYRSYASEEELLARKSEITAPINRTRSSQNGGTQTSYSYPDQANANDYLASRLNNLSTIQKSSYESQNMQDNKLRFYEKDKSGFVTGHYLPDDSIWIDTVIPAVLLSGISTDLPGQIKAQVTENVYDSKTGTVLLIPQGSILNAEYNSSVSYSQKRVQISWNTLVRPDGYQLNLGNMNGVDTAGFSGVRGWVDDHLFEYLKALGIITAFTAINGEFDNQMKALTNQYAANLLQQNQTVINQLGSKLIDRALDVQPSIFVFSGQKVNVLVNKTITLPPFKW